MPPPPKPPPDEPRRGSRTVFWILAVIAVAAGMSALATTTGGERATTIRYDELERWVSEGRVDSVIIGPTDIVGEFAADRIPERDGAVLTSPRFRTPRVEDPTLVQRLLEHDVEVEGERISGWADGT